MFRFLKKIPSINTSIGDRILPHPAWPRAAQKAHNKPPTFPNSPTFSNKPPSKEPWKKIDSDNGGSRNGGANPTPTALTLEINLVSLERKVVLVSAIAELLSFASVIYEYFNNDEMRSIIIYDWHIKRMNEESVEKNLNKLEEQREQLKKKIEENGAILEKKIEGLKLLYHGEAVGEKEEKAYK